MLQFLIEVKEKIMKRNIIFCGFPKHGNKNESVQWQRLSRLTLEISVETIRVFTLRKIFLMSSAIG